VSMRLGASAGPPAAACRSAAERWQRCTPPGAASGMGADVYDRASAVRCGSITIDSGRHPTGMMGHYDSPISF
jgi:hypothetical protein